MKLHKVKINGMEFGCVSTQTPQIETEYYYDETTLDGKRHRKIKGKKTNYKIVFYNDMTSSFYNLMNILSGEYKVTLEVPFNDVYKFGEYFPEIKSYKAKGFLSNGTFFNDGLNVMFDKVGFDE